MKVLIILICLITDVFKEIPDGFVNVKTVIPNLIVDLRYKSSDNFVGRNVDGYKSENLYLSKKAALALKKVQIELNVFGMGLKVFDAYRPQRAVDHFVRWAKDLNDTKTKAKYYPNEPKKTLFKKGYIASKSGHTRGSTLDLTIVELDHEGNEKSELDMGTPWDFFSHRSTTIFSDITTMQKRNRLLLKSIMEKYGFVNYSKEWWHYTLKDEPFKNKYFDFIIK